MSIEAVLANRQSWHIDHSDVLAGLRAMPDASVSSCVTSPPYYQKRAYGGEPQVFGGAADCQHEFESRRYYRTTGGGARSSIEAFSEPGLANSERIKAARWQEDTTCQLCGAWRGELGHEPTPELFVEHLVSIFAEVKRVLRADGTLWVNLGDSRAGAGRSNHLNTGGRKSDDGGKEHGTPAGRYQQTELIGVPWLFAFAMRASGWGLFDHITWAKRAPMPESVKRRTTYATEDIFMFAKSNRYWYDQDAIREPITNTTVQRNTSPRKRSELKGFAAGIYHSNEGMPSHFGDMGDTIGSTRNPWSYWLVDDEPTDTLWHLGPAPLGEEHYAAYPPEIPRRAIAAGSSEHGVCAACGAPWGRVVEREQAPPEVFTQRSAPTDGFVHAGSSVNGEMRGHGQKLQAWREAHPPRTLGWEPSCKCQAPTIPALVLDPFNGSGTSGLVALRLGRRYVGLELNADYVSMSRRRIMGDSPLFNALEVLA